MNRDRKRHWLALGLTVAVVTIVWTVALPWIGAQRSIRARTDFLKRQGIDPSALYYTDLDAMPRLESNMTTLRQAHPAAFWQIDPAAEK